MPLPLKKRLSLALRLLRQGELPQLKSRREVPAITAEEVEDARRFFPMDKFFIYGHARSGTTMLARTIRLHPEVHCNYQAHFFTRAPLLEALVSGEETGEWLKRGSNRWNHGRDLSPVVLRAAADFMLEREARPLGKRIVGDKSPNSLNDGESVRLMHKVYPDGFLVYIARDGRDTVLSHRFQAFIEFPERLGREDQAIRADFARDPEPYLSGAKSVFNDAAIRRAAEGWVRNMHETDSQGKALYGPRYLSLRYEDLLQRPWEEMNRVWSFLGAAPAGAAVQAALQAETGQNPHTN
ncbi:MAG: sulfotransferase family protein, partial [Chloroflexota bacterium]